MLTKITIQKVEGATGNKPTHKLIAADDKYENKVEVGAFWTKDGPHGKFLSGELSKEREWEGKRYDGYVLLTAREYQDLVASRSPSTPVQSTDDVGF